MTELNRTEPSSACRDSIIRFKFVKWLFFKIHVFIRQAYKTVDDDMVMMMVIMVMMMVVMVVIMMMTSVS